MVQNYKKIQGTATALQATEEVTVIAAQGIGTVIRVMNVQISVFLAATGSGVGKVALEDGAGGTRFFEASAEALIHYSLDYGEDGFDLTANTALIVTVDAATTNEASVRVTAICKVLGA